MLWITTLALGIMATQTPEPQWLTVHQTLHEIQQAKWIWVQPSGAPKPTSQGGVQGTFTFSRRFSGGKGMKGTLTFTADNEAEVFLNGRPVTKATDWSSIHSADLTGFLRDGENELSIRVTNTGTADPNAVNPGGLIAALTTRWATGETSLLTDSTWTVSEGKVVELGVANTVPWHLSVPDGPSPIFRREFMVRSVPKKAPLSIVGLGHFQLYVNGQRAGKGAIQQPWSQYDKTIYKQTFEIAPFLQKGANVIAVMLGNGFYRVARPPEGRWVKDDAMPDFSHGRPYLLWVNGVIGSQRIVSDSQWKWTEGPVTLSHIYAGEEFDARKEPVGWKEAGFDDRHWIAPVVAEKPNAEILPYHAPALEACEVFQPKEVKRAPSGSWSYLFPQNCSALLRFRVKGKPGQKVRFRLSEVINLDGTVEQLNLWGRHSETAYTIGSAKSESHQDLFFYHGGQFVGVFDAVPKGQPNPGGLPVIEKLELVHVRTNNAPTGHFVSSAPLLNDTHRLIDWAMRSNMSFVMTDCPHREKLGWLECAHLLANSFAYRYDCQEWFHKICRDLRDSQLKSGRVLTVAPKYLMRPDDDMYAWTVEWGAASVLLPWQAYEWYDDKRFLTENFAMMQAFTDHIEREAKNGIAPGSLGDWYDYGHGHGPGPSRFTPQSLTSTAVWAMCARATARTAHILGDKEAEVKYNALHEQIRKDFRREFWQPEKHAFKNNGSVQTGSTIALEAGLVPESERAAVLAEVIRELEERDYQQTAGDVGHLYFIRALASAGRSDVLSKVYSRTGTGSYGGILAKGLTTLPETWDAITVGSNSLNHCMLGHAMEWTYGYVLGVRQKPDSVGWKEVVIDPAVESAGSCQGSVKTPLGKITLSWKRVDGKVSGTINIPNGMKAYRADGTRIPVGGSRL